MKACFYHASFIFQAFYAVRENRVGVASLKHAPLMKMPAGGLPELLNTWEQDKEVARIVDLVAEHEAERNSVFTSEMRAKLIAVTTPLIGLTGFTPSYVATSAACAYREVLGDQVAAWYPSTSWTYKFMHDELHCTLRRGTTSRPSIETIAETDRLHLRNLRRIAILRANGYADWQFMANDQFGSYLFPQHRSVWTRRGTEDVYVENLEEKRQYTGNICGNGAGEVSWAFSQEGVAKAFFFTTFRFLFSPRCSSSEST